MTDDVAPKAGSTTALEFACGIYGFEITWPIDLGWIQIVPRSISLEEMRTSAREQRGHHLTAIALIAQPDDLLVFRLSAALSFIERLDVLVTPARRVSNEDPFLDLPLTIEGRYRSSGGGQLIASDYLFRHSRRQFLELLFKKLEDACFCTNTTFDKLFFKVTESFRLAKPYVEVQYFFFFSGLEAYARAVTNDFKSRDVAIPIRDALKAHGFDVEIDHASEKLRSIRHYAQLRNALFHNGALECSVDWQGQKITVSIFERLREFEDLVGLAVLKAIGFDDGHTNWNCWIDRQPFM